MNTTVKAILVILFVSGLSAVLVRPILNAYDEQQGPPPRVAAPEPDKSPAPKAKKSPDVEAVGETRLAARYPRKCLRTQPRPSGDGVIAAWHEGRVRIVTPSGDQLGGFRAGLPLQWNSKGNLLATGGGRLFRSDGEFAGSLFGLCTTEGCPELSSFGWSPAGNCALGIADDKLYVGVVGGRTRVLLEGVTDFAFSPNGLALAVLVVSDAELPQAMLALIDLKGSRVVRDSALGGAVARFAGWSTSRDGDVLYWAGPGTSVMADGWPLRAASFGRRSAGYATGSNIVPDPVLVGRCGGRLVAVVGGERYRVTGMRLAYIARNRPPNFITDKDSTYNEFSCNSSGDLIAAVRAPDDGRQGDIAREVARRQLVILNPDGSVLQSLGSDDAIAEFDPMWGPSGTGLLFIRARWMEPPAEVWFAPEGSSARSLGVEASAPLAWSALPVTGLPAI